MTPEEEYQLERVIQRLVINTEHHMPVLPPYEPLAFFEEDTEAAA